MTDEEVKDVNNQESVAPETNSEGQISNAQVNDNSKEYNFARMREKLEAEQKERLELQRQIEEFRRREEERLNPKPQVEADELEGLVDDDLSTIGQVKKLTERQVKQIVNQIFQEREKAELPNRVKKKFSDFDEIMTTENINKFEKEEPELADACTKAANPWEATYKMLKKFLPPKEERKISEAEKKLEENASKPGSINSVGKVKPLSNAEMWSEATKERLYKEMLEYARQV